MARNGYSVKIDNASRELSAKERVMYKDTACCVRLDEATKAGEVVIDIDMWVALSVHNENTADVDYHNYVIVDKDGTRYITGSNGFWNTFTDIWEEMSECEEPWTLTVYRKPSKNYSGKEFITCSIS